MEKKKVKLRNVSKIQSDLTLEQPFHRIIDSVWVSHELALKR